MNPQPTPLQQSNAAALFETVMNAASTKVPVSPQQLEDTINKANTLIYLLSSALSWEIYTQDGHHKRKESTTCGITSIEADLRDELAALL